MTDEEMMLLTKRGREVINDLMEIIPNWQKVILTKHGYNVQYTQTLLDVAIYVIEREKKVLKEIHDED